MERFLDDAESGEGSVASVVGHARLEMHLRTVVAAAYVSRMSPIKCPSRSHGLLVMTVS